MHFVKYLRTKNYVCIAFLFGMSASEMVMAVDTPQQISLGVPGASMNPAALIEAAKNTPNYGGTFVPGIGDSITSVGIPKMDLAALAQALLKKIQQAGIDAEKLLTKQGMSDALGITGQNKVDATNNGAANTIVRVNKAIEDESNMDAVKNAMTSIDACRDIAISLSTKRGDAGCETINTVRESYLGRASTGAMNALMTIAKGLNSNFSTEQSNDIDRVNRISKSYNSDIQSSATRGIYTPSRYTSNDVSTYSKDQMADLPDFIYTQIRPYAVSNKTNDSVSVDTVVAHGEESKILRIKLDKQLAADIYADSLIDKIPGDAGISPYEAMREFAKGKNSTDYLQKIGTSHELSPVLLNRERVIMMAFTIHNKILKYQRSLKMEQIAARELAGELDKNLTRN